MNTKQQPLSLSDIKQDLASQYMTALNNFYEGDNKKTLKFLSAVSYCIQSNGKLLECTKESILQSFMKCAEYNLFPSSVSGEAYILPYWNNTKKINEAQFQLGYKGIVTILYRAGITGIYSDIVKSKDHIRVTGGLDPNIEHSYALEDRGEPIGVYVVAIVKGQKVWKYMSKAEVETFKKFSQSVKNIAYSPWNPDNDPELNMWRKTCLKQLSKLLPQNEEIFKAIEDDNKESSIEDYIESKKHPDKISRPDISKLLDQETESKDSENVDVPDGDDAKNEEGKTDAESNLPDNEKA